MPIISPKATTKATNRCRWSLALDIGEASIGWAVAEVDADGAVIAILNTGVRLFSGTWSETAGTFKANGVEDRLARGQEQRIHNRAQRLAELTRIFADAARCPAEEMKEQVAFQQDGGHHDPYRVFPLRKEASERPLPDLAALYTVIHHMANHRGIRLAAIHLPDDKATTPERHKDKESASAASDERALRAAMNAYPDTRTVTCGTIIGDRVRSARAAGHQPLTRARRDAYQNAHVQTPTRALIEQEFDTLRAVQEPAFPALPWADLRRLVIDQAPIALPPAADCLFLGPLHQKGHAFQGITLTEENIRRGQAVDPLMLALRVREAVGNLRVLEQVNDGQRLSYRPRSQEGLDHGKLDAAERNTLVDHILRHDHETVTYPALRTCIGLKAPKFRFSAERDKEGDGIRGNPTDPFMARWIPAWFDYPVKARSAFVREILVTHRADSHGLEAFLTEGGHGIPGIPADHAKACTAALLESPLYKSELYSVSHLAAAAILDAWDATPTDGFYEVTRRLFGFSPNELIVSDLQRARARLHEALPHALERARTTSSPGIRRHAVLPEYKDVIPSQLMTTLKRGHKGKPITHMWTGNANTHHILCEVRKTVNELLARFAGRRSGKRTYDLLPSRLTVELAREAKNGVTRRNEIHQEQHQRKTENEKARKNLQQWSDKNDVRWAGLPLDRAALRLRLAEHQDWHCPYCDNTIRATDLFGADLEIDHIIPRAIGSDSRNNFALAHKTCNANKSNRTPHEAFGDRLDRPALGAMWRNFRKAEPAKSGRKAKLATLQADDDFMARIGWRFTEKARQQAEESSERRNRRMLNDTARATRLARLYLTALVLPEDTTRLGTPTGRKDSESPAEVYRAMARVQAVNGSVTATLRKRLLQVAKDRDGTRHHAEDACLLLLAGPTVVQAFSTDRGRAPDAPDAPPPADVAPAADNHHLQRLRRADGRGSAATLEQVLAELVTPGPYDPVTGEVRWDRTRKGLGLSRRITDLVSKARIDIRPEHPPATGSPGTLHNDTHYARRIVQVNEKTETVFCKRMSATDLIAMIKNKEKLTDAGIALDSAPGDVVRHVVCTAIEERHDRVVDQQEHYTHRWISTRLKALLPRHAATVMAEADELSALEALTDTQRTQEQEARRQFLRQGKLYMITSANTPKNAIRAREAEILLRAITDPAWGPRGLRGLSMTETKPIKPVQIRTKKRDALGNPAPGAAVWVKTDGNSASQLWSISSVVNAAGQRIALPKPVLVTIEISTLEYACLNSLDTSLGGNSANNPPPLRKDISRLVALHRSCDGKDGAYLATAIPQLEAKVRSSMSSAKNRARLGENWTLDAEGATCEAEVHKRDSIVIDGITFRVTILTKGYIFGLPTDYAGSAPRKIEDEQAFTERYGRKALKGKGVTLPADHFLNKS